MTSTHDITLPFDEPFFEGGGPEVDDWGMPVSIDGRGFILDTASEQFSRRSVQLLNTQQAQSGLDQSVTPPEVWRRPAESWHFGADQARYDKADSNAFRFNQSNGIDPWNKFGIELLPTTTRLLTLAANETALLEAIGTTLFAAVGATLHTFPNGGTSGATTHPLGSVAVAMCADGQNLYVLTANGTIHRRSAAGAWTTHGTVAGLIPTRAMLAYVKGFIVVGNGPALIDYTVGSAPVTIFTHRLADWEWRAASEGLSVVYVLGGIGDRWHIHRVGIRDTGDRLEPPIVAATLPDGEIAYALATYLGYVLVGVNSGWRFGMPESSGAITYGQLIETPAPVLCFEGQDRFVWFGLSLQTGQATKKAVTDRTIFTEGCGLGRADLSIFVAPMTPAAASDLMGTGTGTTRDVVSIGGELDGLGKRVFSIDGRGIYVESDELVTEGWLSQGSISFNSTDQKMGLYAQVFHEPLVGSIAVEVADDRDLIYRTIGTNDRPGSVSVGNMQHPVAFNAIQMRYRLYRSAEDAKRGPRITRTEFRAINVPGRATEWRIPLIVAQDQHYGNVERVRDVASDYDYLIGLIQSRRRFAYREGERTWFLHATDFVWAPSTLTDDRKTYQGVFLLVAREIA